MHFGGKSLYGVALLGNALLLGIAVLVSKPTLSGCLSAAACGLQLLDAEGDNPMGPLRLKVVSTLLRP